MPDSAYAAAMDANQCRVVYVDDRFIADRWVSRGSMSSTFSEPTYSARGMAIPSELQPNVDALMQIFTQVYLCKSGRAFSSKLAELSESVVSECSPILALIDIPPETRHDLSPGSGSRIRKQLSMSPQLGSESPPMPTLQRSFTFTSESDESYGLQLLARIVSDLQVQENGGLVIPIAVTRTTVAETPSDGALESISEYPFGRRKSTISVASRRPALGEPQLMVKCVDAGAVDVVIQQLDSSRVISLLGHAYKAYKTARKAQSRFMSAKKSRRHSWVGMEEQKPYAYLRESMVRKLMNRICDPEAGPEETQFPDLSIDEERKSVIAEAVGKWAFCAHDFSEEELVYAASRMLNHAVQMKELRKWRLPFDGLVTFVQAARLAYNSFVIYHNFRHAIDVLQSVFYFLVQIQALPAYPQNGETIDHSPPDPSTLASLVKPFEAMTLLISAIGHDVGHPGVNNMFLVRLNAPLAQLYNDQSVLEAFHCAAYSQILRQHWPAAFEDKALRKLLISSILATDMGIHSEYMQELGHLQSKVGDKKTIEEWSPKDMEQYKVLTCGLLIKCADISNVARPWAIAERWTHLLQEEFANQGEMEKEVGMDSCLFGGPPELGNMLKLANAQIGFMSLFAFPLFDGVADVLPQISFAPQEITKNKGVWFGRAEQEKRIASLKRDVGVSEGQVSVSPRSRSPQLLKEHHASDPTCYVSPVGNVHESSPLRNQQAVASNKGLGTSGLGTPTSPGGTSTANSADFPEKTTGASSSTTQLTASSRALESNNTSSRSQPLGGRFDGNNAATGTVPSSRTRPVGTDENESPGGEKTTTMALKSSSVLPSLDLKLPSSDDAHRSSAPANLPLHIRRTSQPRQNSATAVPQTGTVPTNVTSASTQATSLLSDASDLESGKADTTTERTTSTSAAPESESGAPNSRDTEGSRPCDRSDRNGKSRFETAFLHRSQDATNKDQGTPTGLEENRTMRTVPKRKSRIKLAFWKRSKSTDIGE